MFHSPPLTQLPLVLQNIKKIHELGENFMTDFSLSSNIGSIGGMYNIESDFLELKQTSGFESVDGHVEWIKCKDDTMRRAFN